MAPEVMEGKYFNEKADIYSYGICLWEMVTCRDPFPNHHDFDKFQRAICHDKERPIIPANTEKSLADLIRICWDADFTKRPDMALVTSKLDEILIDLAIKDPHGRIFWKSYFLKKHRVEWKLFIESFYNFLHLELPFDEEDDATQIDGKGKKRPRNMTCSEEDLIELRCLRQLLTKPESPSGITKTSSTSPLYVHSSTFGNLLDWFGFLEKPPVQQNFNFLSRIKNLCSQPYFHGDISTEESGSRLMEQKIGTYLVRFSSGVPGAYTISRVYSENGDRKFGNLRVAFKPGEGFGFSDQMKPYATLEELLNVVSEKLNLQYPCQGSKFLSLFWE